MTLCRVGKTMQSRISSLRPRFSSSAPSTTLAIQRDLEVLQDESGTVMFGWLAPGVCYTRLEGGFSARTGYDFAARLSTMFASVPSLAFFGDASRLESYDLLARSAFVRVILSSRKKLTSLAMLTGCGTRSAGRSLAATLGEPLQTCTDIAAFEARLKKVAPSALTKLQTAVNALNRRKPAQSAKRFPVER